MGTSSANLVDLWGGGCSIYIYIYIERERETQTQTKPSLQPSIPYLLRPFCSSTRSAWQHTSPTSGARHGCSGLCATRLLLQELSSEQESCKKPTHLYAFICIYIHIRTHMHVFIVRHEFADSFLSHLA